ncbi:MULTISPECIES: alpha/beta fold hydrolase [Ramlibacter]|uniref:Polyhydroxyalkanoic acid synthase n=1 Tax=Ramlibacter aquaticus TaxID=2780094 RepID=A0ABR9SJP5_9BURK|nr:MULTISPECIES: alpha/beta fold hydrolase [Ramlibacter]MBE7942578.1 polyhydroxyalkanoic acid synthase [Ramlibacter aquaticus]
MPETAPKTSPADGPAAMDLPLQLAVARLANGISPASLAQAWADWGMHLAVTPSKQAELAASAAQKALAWSTFLAQAVQGHCEDCVHPAPQDKRFARPAWHDMPYSALSQAFLLLEQWWGEATTGVRGVSRHHEELASFLARQWLDMCSPSNFVATNPQVLQETVRSGGLNLANGFVNWARDAAAVAAGGRPRGVEAFEPGRGVALTPGKVVFRNALIELLQYEPSTPQVRREPVLVVPSWIMKYYILDLTPDDSLVRYLVGQGYTVFALSWRNPGSEQAGLSMDDYLAQGVLAAVEAVQQAVPGTPLHAMGYCLGGTLLSIAAAVLARRGGHPLKTVSLLAAETDFAEPGELGLFIDESQLAFLEDLMAERGYLDGVQMAGAFQLINSKDLVWSKLVHEYLMGASTPMTAMRAWNADATRMPMRMHSEYLRRLYLHNELAMGRYVALGQPVDLHAIRVPLFVLGTERDHVSPWKSVYKIARRVGGPVRFVLASGGHNVGIVSPPEGPLASPEASFRHAEHAPGAAPDDPQAWFDAAPAEAGSWWPHWVRWLDTHSSRGRVKARPVRGLRGPDGKTVAAPGSYVFQR